MDLKLTYEFPKKLKTFFMAMIGLGALLTIISFAMDSPPAGMDAEHYHHSRFWSNILINSFFFMGIGLGATFYMALKYGSEAHYATVFKRVYEAISTWLPIGLGILFLMLVLGKLGVHHLYHWMDNGVMDKTSPAYDEKIAAKGGYFGLFFWVRAVVFMGVWWFIGMKLRQNSLMEDQQGGTGLHFRNVRLSAIFLVFFGFTSSVAAWDWVMSLDVHWFSTMFGWYIFSGIWLSAMIMILMFVLYLQGKGYLEYVNDSHVHDLGKWVFAISFLWSYLFFCQFMLIWYANIPDEVTFFQHRWEHGYKTFMWIMFFVNFALPMILLMSRDAKRSRGFLIFVCSVIFVFHWLDIFFVVMPSTVGKNWGISFYEVGPFIMFLGGLLFWVHNKLTQAPLLPLKHPYLEESKHHHT